MKFIAIIIFLLIGPELICQTYTSRNNYTGNWDDPATWNGVRPDPAYFVEGADLNIYGYVSIDSSLTHQGTSSTITIYDTLVIYGDLSLGNNSNLVVDEDGLLVIRGSLKVVNNTNIFTNGYIIVTGDFINGSSEYGGSFWTVTNPSKVFIFGTVPGIDSFYYPILDCNDPILDPFTNSGCAYGNIYDLENDPVYGFFTTTCNINFTSSSNSPLCEGSTLSLFASGGSGYLWNGPAGFTSNLQNPEIINATVDESGEYIVRAIIPGCNMTDTVAVVIQKRPEITAAVSTPVCEGETAVFNVSGADAYTWSGPDSFNSNLTSPARGPVELNHEGQYTVVGTAGFCSDTAVVFLDVLSNPLVTASVNSPVCEGSAVRFTASGASDYSWTGPESFYSNAADPVIPEANVTMTGFYVVNGTVSGCNASDTVMLVINSSPVVSISGNTPLCEGENLILAATGGVSFVWYGPEGFYSEEQNPSIENAGIVKSGEYRMKSVSAEGCYDSAVFSVVINPYPLADAGEDILLENTFETSMNAVSDGYESGKWTVLSGSGIFSDENSPASLLTGLSEGENIFRWTTANEACYSSDDIVIKVITLFIPNVITPNSDGCNDNLVISATGSNAELIIFNRIGITVYSSEDYRNDWSGTDYSGKELPDDTYFYILRLRSGVVRKGSVLIKRR